MSRRALIMGFDTLGLNYSRNDAINMKSSLEAHGYESTLIERKLDPNETKSNILTKLDQFLDECSKSDTVIIFFSGHAFAPEGELLLLIDSNLDKPNASSVKLSYVFSAIENCRAASKLLILDCCYALSQIYEWRPPQSDRYRVLAASGRFEKAKELDNIGGSYLTSKIVEALTSKRAEVSGTDLHLSLSGLYGWIVSETKRYNGQNTDQVPVPRLLGDQGHDFIIGQSDILPYPLDVTKYISQLRLCSTGCNRACIGRYPWCRTTIDIGFIHDFYVMPEVKYAHNGSVVKREKLESFLFNWLNSLGSTQLAILGDSGIGKSCACLYFSVALASQLDLSRDEGTIPIYLSLENIARRNLLSRDIRTILSEVLGIDLQLDTLNDYIQGGRLLFLLDGFDEIADRADHGQILRTLKQLDPIIASGCRVIVTCRTHFFVDQSQVENILRGDARAGTDLYAALTEQHPQFRIVELQEFSEPEITELIEKRNPKDAKAIWNTIKSLYNLRDLSRRPILLTLILHTLPKLMKSRTKINRVSIYRAYVEFWLKREAQRIDSSVEITKKVEFIEYIAVEMWRKNIGSIAYAELQAEIRKNYSEDILSTSDYYVRDYDTRTASFFNRDESGYYRFMHKSFMEYFVACALINDLGQEGADINSWSHKWFDKEVAGFISEEIQHESKRKSIEKLVLLCLSSIKRVVLWNVLHILSLIEKDVFHEHVSDEFFDALVRKAEDEGNAVILRQYCRIIARFGDVNKAVELIDRVIEIARNDTSQNQDNNQTYVNYYYGTSSACEALFSHVSTQRSKYDRSLHIYVLGEIGGTKHVDRLKKLSSAWTNEDHVALAREATEKLLNRK